MSEVKEVNIDLVKGTLSDYIIRDKNRIVIGRFTILELDKDNKRCDVKLKFYRYNDSDLLNETIKSILRAIFKDSSVHKANFIVNENANFKVFIDLGFVLEGIFSDNLFINGHFVDELSFGINRNDYNNFMITSIIRLKGENIEIRNLTPESADELLDYYIRNKDHLSPYEPSRDASFYTYEMQRDILIESYRQLMSGTGYDLGIYIDDKLIGKAKVSNIVYGIFKSAILGYSIDKDYQGKGYMKEAVRLILDYAKNELELHRVEASVLVDNERSKGVLLGCGFKEIGINEKYLYINGSWRDHLTLYKILED
ncbi:GNAT family N-acetyltransferase [Clostridium chauvoei]|uniref:GNAT family N-acetyltransferase n=2 Tax=Clostridium chauvoei TaxID=46867 RepID=A0ABD4RKC4_9CLOT|nr:GNAT family protein [Clostridium chauvoei]ATD54012.1 GNAT family N-acetyltransferase [Clostridium chauvoei]ATD58535.1 GNAT family N-acetyltransferase [Clostridium chauvoei]MBX7281788.1 GNAT family N-acetyltransferase [Clostridium chauvoei]MBX7284319.1 GNAT family N-acetyltransferase [Clostridium chauvoei]MBX7286817.1 GNAT family N-acetyltransferase [Clostridium chauvoei]